MRGRTVVAGAIFALTLGMVTLAGTGRVEAAPFRTVLDLGPQEIRQQVYRGFGLLGQGEICSTYFVNGPQGLQSTIGPTPGYEGYVIVLIIDARNQPVADLEFRGTTCRTLNLPSGSYFLKAIPGAGIFRLEVNDILSNG